MGALTLNFLGGLEVIRDGRLMPLPPSRKTRALLAYLALHHRPLGREHLCEVFWEVPDDPRGALRWSLSKLRRLVDDPGQPRIVSDRLNVGFDSSGADIDALALDDAVREGLEQASTPVLEAVAQRYRGELLENLDLSRCHDFQAWCLAEREKAVRQQASVLATLVKRLAAQPPQALPYARAWARLAPYDEVAWSTLIRLLVAVNRPDEAEQQYRLGVGVLRKGGVTPSDTFHQARRVGWSMPPGRPGESPPANLPATSLPTGPPEEREPVGRQGQLQWLLALFAQVCRQPRAAFVLLSGEPGIGKTHLLSIVAKHLRESGAYLIEASAIEADTLRPYALWIDAFRRLDAAGAEEITEHDNRDRLFASLNRRLVEACQQRPVAILFDDMQWCDESSAAALHYVARMNPDKPLLGILAARDAGLQGSALLPALRGLRHDGLLEELRLDPLPEDAARMLIARLAPQADIARLAMGARGNPLLAIELARAQAAGDSGLSLEELVRERLDHLDPQAAEVMRWAALLAPRIEPTVLRRVTGLATEHIDAALEASERLGLLHTDEQGLAFSHDLVAQGVYQSMPPARRQMMHRRVAELLEQDTTLDLERAAGLAHHALQGGDVDLAARAMVCAGRLCLRFFANGDALKLARNGIGLAARLPEARRICLTLELNEIMLSAETPEDWETRASELVSLAEQALEHGELAHARLGYQLASTVRWAHGEWRVAREAALQAERVTRGGTDQEHIIALAETAKCLAMLERNLGQAQAMLKEVQALAGRRLTDCPAIPMALGLLHFHADRLEEAEEHYQAARTLYRASGDRLGEFQANEYLLMLDIERDDFPAALERCVALTELAHKLRDGSEAPFAEAAQGLCRYAIDDDETAFVASLDALRQADAKYRLAYLLTRAALLDLARGRAAMAARRADEALTYAQALERATEAALAHCVLARANCMTGKEAGGLQHAAAVDGFRQAPVARWAWRRVQELLAEVRMEHD